MRHRPWFLGLLTTGGITCTWIAACGTGPHGPLVGESSARARASSESIAAPGTSEAKGGAASSAAPSPSEAPSAGLPLDPHPAEVRVGPQGAGSIGCGAASCSATKEVCCADAEHAAYACATRVETPSPRLFEGPGGQVDLEHPVCKTASGEAMSEPKLWFCDSSDDCAAGEVCCRQNLGWTMCVRALGAPASACHDSEACSEGTCRSKGARCDLADASCRRTKQHVSCGGATCTDEAPFCCATSTTSTCVAASAACDGSDTYRFECRTSADCLSGQKCCVSNFGSTHCGGTCWNDDIPTCTTAADCRGVPAHSYEFGSLSADACGFIPMTGIQSCMTADEASSMRQLRSQP
ncbi:MAG: hypothetical protein U0414_12670 [Polyangiaceae bacterium]